MRLEEATKLVCERVGSDAATYWTKNESAEITDLGDVYTIDTDGNREYLSDSDLIRFAEWLLTA